jgi:glycosyltransferase involved in cell wall biosynthesis
MSSETLQNQMSSPGKPMLTVIAQPFPPEMSASSIVLDSLFSSYSGRLTAVGGFDPYSRRDPAFQPPCPTHYLAIPRRLSRAYPRIKKKFPAITSRILQISIQRCLRAFGTDLVLGLYPFDDHFVASFFAARQLSLPFYALMHDLWVENIPPGRLHRFAEKWEPTILKESTRVLCMTENMQEYYEKKYNIGTDLLPHTVSEKVLFNLPSSILQSEVSRPTVLYIGTVSPQMNLDALKQLASASELLPEAYELLFLTSMDLSSLNRLGIRSNRLRIVKFGAREEVHALSSKAHVLVAPLSHKNCSTEEVQTVFSSKLLDYLISGRPIVVFAPECSFHARSASANGWGYVVTDDSPLALATAIIRVATDKRLAGQLVQGALREASSRNARFHASRLKAWAYKDALRGTITAKATSRDNLKTAYE